MSDVTPDRPDMDDDLDQAYARAHALADDGRGPAASVRANVLAAAAEVAAQARARVGVEAVAPVASPVAEVGRGRAAAVNLSSWRVRSGAAVCAALLVTLGVWRFDVGRRADGDMQVATASVELAPAPTTPLRRELPAPAPLPMASAPILPPPVVDDPLEHRQVADAAAKRGARDRSADIVVAQAEQSERAPRAMAPPEAPRPAAPPAPALVFAPAPPAATPPAPAPAPAPVAAAPETSSTVTITGPASTQLATLPAMPPSALPRRVPVVPSAKPASEGELRMAQADVPGQRVELTGSSIKRIDASDAANLNAAKAARSSLGATAMRKPGTTLQAAADRGDVEALKTLLAEPAAQVDAPDAAGRTALLHAVLAQQAAAVRLLLGAGADPARADPAGLTPRAAAQAGASAEIAALLATPR